MYAKIDCPLAPGTPEGVSMVQYVPVVSAPFQNFTVIRGERDGDVAQPDFGYFVYPTGRQTQQKELIRVEGVYPRKQVSIPKDIPVFDESGKPVTGKARPSKFYLVEQVVTSMVYHSPRITGEKLTSLIAAFEASPFG